MDFQDQNRIYEIKPEYFNQNLSKKSRINQDNVACGDKDPQYIFRMGSLQSAEPS
jgi:hypothetical protein